MISKLTTATTLAGLLLFKIGCSSTSSTKTTPKVTEQSAQQAQKSAEVAAKRRSDDLKTRKGQIEKQIQLEPDNGGLYSELADVNFKLGLPEDALKSADVALTKDGSDKNAIVVKSKSMAALGRSHDGIAFLNEQGVSLEKDSARDPELLSMLAAFYRKEKKYDESAKAISMVLARHEGHGEALRNLALLHYEQGNMSLAQTVAANALKINSQDAEVINALGMIEVKKNKLPAAIQYFRQALELDNSLVGAHLNIAAIALKYRDYASAKLHYEKAVGLVPNHADANLGLGLSLAGLQESDSAISKLTQALEMNPKANDARFELSRVFKFQKSDLAQALKWSNDYLANAPGLNESHPAKIHHQNIVNEIEAAKMAEEAMDDSSQEEGEASEEG